MQNVIFDIVQVDPKPGSALSSERGVALIIVLVVLVLLSILGATVLSTSTTEIKIAGNYRGIQESFFSADAAVSYAQTSPVIYNRIRPGIFNTYTASNVSIGTSKADVKVDYLSSGAIPPGTGTDPEAFQAQYFVVTVSSTGRNNSKTVIESQVARIVPK
jgi:Tfp pilus assembly protein PilX